MAIPTPTVQAVPRVRGETRSTSFWKQSKRVLGRDWPIAYLFVAPLVILLFGLIAYPLLRAVSLSFFNVTGITNRGFVGLQNYERLWTNDQFVRSVLITVQFAVSAVFFKFWIGLTAALLLHRKGLRFRSVFTGLVLLPWVIPDIVAALTWRGLYDPVFGGLNMLLIRIGLIDQGISWLGDYNLALPSVIAVNVWKGVPFFTIVLLAGLKALDTELFDAAAVDGANALAALPQHYPARLALRHHRRLPAFADLDPQRLRPGLPADRRRSGRLHPALLDLGLRVRDRFPPL